MPYDAELGRVISAQFRAASSTRLDSLQLNGFERLLQILFGLRNLRNAQLWTRFGTQTRDFINRGLGELELDIRTFVATKFINNIEPMFPVKRKPFQFPVDSASVRKFFEYITDNFIREYCTRIFVEGRFIIIEYASDSDTPAESPDLDSPEFEDITE